MNEDRIRPIGKFHTRFTDEVHVMVKDPKIKMPYLLCGYTDEGRLYGSYAGTAAVTCVDCIQELADGEDLH